MTPRRIDQLLAAGIVIVLGMVAAGFIGGASQSATAQPAAESRRVSFAGTEPAVLVSVSVDVTTNDFRNGIVIDGAETLLLDLTNTGSYALDAFQFDYSVGASASWRTLLSGTDFDSTSIPSLVFCTTTGPHELTAGSTASLIIDVRGMYAVRFTASASGTATSVSYIGTAR